MQKVVESGCKLDLHIHSAMSYSKDGAKVKNNTLENIPLLITKLNEQKVNICAITDHDTFSYDMYTALKKAENQSGSIKKVLPGVEFSVRFISSDDTERVVHIVAIFSDKDNGKVILIEEILQQMRPDDGISYSEESFLKILRAIDLDTILVAHQKNTLGSKSVRKNDATSLGEDRFLEFVATDFFEAYEFKNKRNEILNKNHLISCHLEEKVRFITGTDCHDWSVYPREDSSDACADFPYTFARCLPTFKGLVMAVTDWKRLKRVNSFYSADKFTLSQIELEHNDTNISIPLSKGINVIIGDNSIGKSLLLHALTGNEKVGQILPRSVKDGYKTYLSKNKLKIKKQLKQEQIFAFDMQGEIRSKFEQGQLVSTEFAKYFPEAPSAQPYKTLILNEIDRLIEYLRRKFQLDSAISKLGSFSIYTDEGVPESLTFVGNLRGKKAATNDVDRIEAALQQIQIDLSLLLNFPLDEDDTVHFKNETQIIAQIASKYQARKAAITAENNRIEIIASAIDDTSKRHSRSISDHHKKASAFLDHSVALKESLIDIIQQRSALKPYSPGIIPTDVAIATNRIQQYSFVTKLQVSHIDNEYFCRHLSGILKAGTIIDFATITEKRLKDILLKYDSTVPVLQFLKNALIESFEPDFVPKSTITLQTADATEELSAGLNAKIYFDLLSYENSIDGVYIIDQPEDNVSQPSIKAYLLECFKTMGEHRQVLMVSHNPQFIVNLDVDNLIFISRALDGSLSVKSGALEYEDAEYNILRIVEDNIDGGLDSLQKRWKRYEKINRV